jgi:hypothetical protein
MGSCAISPFCGSLLLQLLRVPRVKRLRRIIVGSDFIRVLSFRRGPTFFAIH